MAIVFSDPLRKATATRAVTQSLSCWRKTRTRMSGMGDGYVGTAQDAVRIRRLEKQREAERRKIQELKAKTASAKGQPGLLQFGSSTSEVLIRFQFYSFFFPLFSIHCTCSFFLHNFDDLGLKTYMGFWKFCSWCIRFWRLRSRRKLLVWWREKSMLRRYRKKLWYKNVSLYW